MSSRPRASIDEIIRRLLDECDRRAEEFRLKMDAVEHLTAARDGMTPQQRRDVRELEDLYSRPYKQDRHRRPPRPVFGGGSDG